jgi:soluble P-type ATPase
MIEITIPGSGKIQLEHLVLDYNGTLARDGDLLEGVAECLTALAQILTIHVITADTFGKVEAAMAGLPCTVRILPQTGQGHAKMAYVWQLDRTRVAAIGNGRNDRLMLQAAKLGIAIVGPEGASLDTLHAADVAVPHIHAALELLLHPLRLVATLRS